MTIQAVFMVVIFGVVIIASIVNVVSGRKKGKEQEASAGDRESV